MEKLKRPVYSKAGTDDFFFKDAHRNKRNYFTKLILVPI